MARIGLLNGIPYARYHEYQCDLGTTNLAYGSAASDYEIPIAHRNQLDAKATLYVNSEGDDGRHLYGFAKDESTQGFIVPHTLTLVQADGMDDDVLFGIALGSCLGSLHVSGTSSTFSLCGYRKSDGYEWEIRSWSGDFEVDVTMSAFDPKNRLYYFYAFGGASDPQDYLVEVNVDSGEDFFGRVPDDVDGTVESLVHDHDWETPRLYSARIVNGTSIMFGVSREPGWGPQFVPLADFSLDEDSRQEFALVGSFEGNLGGNDDFARYFSLLYEHRWHQHEMRKTAFSKDLPELGTRANLPGKSVPVVSEYVLFADVVGMAVANMYVGPDPAASDGVAYIRSCHGEHCTKVGSHIDMPSTPSIIYVGEFNKLTLENQSLTVEITIDDLDTPLVELKLHVESSNPRVIRESDIEELRSRNGTSEHAWKDRRLRIRPRAGARGMARLTAFVTDGAGFSKASFVVFVGKNATDCQMSGALDDGCEYIAVSKEIHTPLCRVIEDDDYDAVQHTGLVAGDQLQFRVQSVNRFNYDLSENANFEGVFHADIASASVFHNQSDVAYHQKGQYRVVTNALDVTGVWVTHIQGWDGQPILGSPFSVEVFPAALDPQQLEFVGPGAMEALQGSPALYPEGNRLTVTAYDSYKNLRFLGGDRFGVDPLDWQDEWGPDAFQANITNTPNPAVYDMVYWFGSAMYTQEIALCAADGGSTEVGPGTCDGKTSSTPLRVYVTPRAFYEDNGIGEFEVAESYLFYTQACPPADPFDRAGRARWQGINADEDGGGAPTAACWKAVAGFVWSGLYVQSVDEFGAELPNEDTTASSNIIAGTISETAAMDAESRPAVMYRDHGVFNVSIVFSLAGWQPLYVFATDEMIPGSPFMVYVEPGDLSPSHSYCDGDGIVMATSGTDETVREGNHFYINSRDRYDNPRMGGSDMFTIDPLEDKNFFRASISRDDENGDPLPGDRLHVTYWWAASFVQKFEVCPLWDLSDPSSRLTTVPFEAVTEPPGIGVFENCLRFSDDVGTPDTDAWRRRVGCGPQCKNETRMVGSALEKGMPLEVYMRENQGSPITSAGHSTLVCLNNINDNSACYMLHGKAGDLSSFTIEAKNELSFPNFRGGDVFFCRLTRIQTDADGNAVRVAGRGVPSEPLREYTADVNYLRIQFYEVSYEPTIAGIYEMSITMEDENNLEVPVGTGTWGAGTYPVLVSPGSPYAPHTTFESATTIVCGEESRVISEIRDMYNNSVNYDEGNRLNIRATTRAVATDFAPEPGNTTGQYVSVLQMELMGPYVLQVQIQTPCEGIQCQGRLFDEVDVYGSPVDIVLLAAPFSPADTNISNYFSSTVAHDDNSFMLQTQDRFGNMVPETDLTIQLEWISYDEGFQPAALRAPVDLGEGSYSIDFSATHAGPYTYRILVARAQTQLVALHNRFDLLDPQSVLFGLSVYPGPAFGGVASGPGILGAVAGVGTIFDVTVQDQYDNVRDVEDDVSVLFVDAAATNASNPVQTLIIGDGLNPDPDAVGNYRATYTLTQARRYRLYFFVAVDSDVIQLNVPVQPFSVTSGPLDRPRLTFPNSDAESTNVVAMAGLGTAVEIQLLDSFGNLRYVDDAVLDITVRVADGASWSDLPEEEIDYLGYVYTSDGVYVATLQLNTAATYRVLCKVTDAATALQEGVESFYPLEQGGLGQEKVQCGDTECFSTLFVRAGFASVQRCVAGTDGIIQSIATSAMASQFQITLFDQFDNRNLNQGSLLEGDANYLAVEVLLDGGINPEDQSTTIVAGTPTWDDANSHFMVEYTPIFAGPYTMSISIDGELLRTQTVTVMAGDVSPEQCTASGVGLLRTEPKRSQLDLLRETPWAPSIVSLRVRDANRNNVDELDVAMFSVYVKRQCEDRDNCTPEEEEEPPLECELDAVFTNERNGNLNLEYFLHFDDGADSLPGTDETEASGTGGRMCGGYEVDYDDVPYRIGIVHNGREIGEIGTAERSPFDVKVGRYKPPDHAAYITSCAPPACTTLGQQVAGDGITRFDTCASYSAQCNGGPAGQNEYIIADSVVTAGTETSIYFQNVYRTGNPGCQVLECEERIDDYSAEQIDQTTSVRADFAATVMDRTTGGAVDVGTWYNEELFSTPDDGLYTLRYNIERAGEYTIAITVGGTPIRMGGIENPLDCLFNVTVTPTVAQAIRTMLSGHLVQTSVESDSIIRATASDEYGNVRADEDSITMEFSSQHATSGPTPVVVFDPDVPEYTITYTVHRCPGTAGFMIYCNGEPVQTEMYTVPCTAGAIASQTEAVDDVDGSGRSVIADTPILVAGVTETIKLQARDQYENLKRAGGESGSIHASHMEAEDPVSGEAQILDISNRVQDNNDGTYYLSYPVRYAGMSQIAVSINGGPAPGAASNSPYFAQIVAAAMFPGTTDAHVAAQVEVGSTFVLAINQRDSFENAVSEVPTGQYIAYLNGQLFEADISSPLQIQLMWTVSGDQQIEVFYRDTSGSTIRIDTDTDGTYELYLSPGPAVVHATVIAEDVQLQDNPSCVCPGQNQPRRRPIACDICPGRVQARADSMQRTQDCVSNQESVILIQTVDEYGNNCDEPIANENDFDGFVLECSDGTQDCAATSTSPNYPARFTYRPDAPGIYKISYTVAGTGWHYLQMRFGMDNIIGAPFVILSDTAAVPELCIAAGPGLIDSVAGRPAEFDITARGGTAATPLARQGAGDNFEVTIMDMDGGDITTEQVATTLEYLGSGRYRCTTVAVSYHHSTPTWLYQVRVRLMDPDAQEMRNIAGSPFTVTMSPDVTAAHYSYAYDGNLDDGRNGLEAAVAGTVAQLRVRGKDAYNNQVYNCGDGFSARLAFVSSSFAVDSCSVASDELGYMQYARNELVPEDSCTAVDDIQAVDVRASCEEAAYLLQYGAEVAGQYDLFVMFEGDLIQQHAPNCREAGGAEGCTDNPWRVTVESGVINARYSFLSQSGQLDSQPAETGDFDVTVAGQRMLQYLHAFDQYQNRLTTAACASGSSCIAISFFWCQSSQNMTVVGGGRSDTFTMQMREVEGPDVCEAADKLLDPLEINTTVADTGEIESWSSPGLFMLDGVYRVEAQPTRAGGMLVAADIDDGSGVFQAADRVFRPVTNDVAVPWMTQAAPAERSVSDEDITFPVRPHDRYGNFVDNPDLDLSIQIEFLTEVENGMINTTMEYNPADGTFQAGYNIQTGGSAAIIQLHVLLAGVRSNEEGYTIRLRAATNKPRFCYVLSRTRGKQEYRWHDFSRDLMNEDSKVAGTNLTVTVQSMTKDGPRTVDPESVCTAQQIAEDSMECERLDEFDVDAETTLRNGERYSVTGYGASCRTSPGCFGVEPCDPNDCTREGWYEVKWSTTVSGTYDLYIQSLGIVIQQPPRAGELFQPGHDFDEYMPFSVEIYPAAMDAMESSITVPELNLGQDSYVEIIGRDSFGNRLLEDLGEAQALGVRLRTECVPTEGEDEDFAEDFPVTYFDNPDQPGTFRARIRPQYGGPTQVMAYLKMDCFVPTTTRQTHRLVNEATCHPMPSDEHAGGLLVGGTAYPQIATIGISILEPNTGHIDGTTRVTAPLHGLCGYENNWDIHFKCKWETETSAGQLLREIRDATPLVTEGGRIARVQVDIESAPQEITWSVENRIGRQRIGAPLVQGTMGHAQYSYLPNRVGDAWTCGGPEGSICGADGEPVPIDADEDGEPDCTDIDPELLDARLPGSCAELLVEQQCSTSTLEFSAAFVAGTTVSDLCCQSCRAESAPLALADSWSLPTGGDYNLWLVLRSEWGSPVNVTIRDDMDRRVLTEAAPPAVLTITSEGDFIGETETAWHINLQAPLVIECDPSPSTEAITGIASLEARVVDFSIQAEFIGGTGVFEELDESTTYQSVNTRSYFYYPHPVLDAVVPRAARLVEAWDQAYAPISGGMSLVVRGSGFDTGDGAQKNHYLCIFSDRDCSAIDGVAQCVNDDPQYDYDTADCSRDSAGTLRCAPRAGLWISEAEYVSDTQLYCTCPPVESTGYTSLEISSNAQEVAPTQLFMVYYGLTNQTVPKLSAIGGGRAVQLTLIDGPETLGGLCRFGMFQDDEGRIGMDPVVAIRIDASTLQCITPDAADQEQVEPNGWTGVCISFDDGETYSEPSFMIYYAQPAINQLMPPLTITQGGTHLKVELLAGAYLDSTTEQTAYDFKSFQDALVPRCIFKQTQSRVRGSVCAACEVPGVFHVVQQPYPDDHERAGQTYESQQIWCYTPSNPIPGSNLYVETSFDNGTSYNYEDYAQLYDPPALKYYAETSIITEQSASELLDAYLAAPFFRMRASGRGDEVEVRFQYSCGYSPQYESLIRCRFGESEQSPEVITETVPGTLQLGADSQNSVVCQVPGQALPTRKPLAIALNGVDFTGETDDTVYVWFGEAIGIRGGYVRSRTDGDRQDSFTTRAAFITALDLIVIEIVDRAGNYVSEDALYQDALVNLDLELVTSGNRTSVYTTGENLVKGQTFFEEIQIMKPRVGNYEATMWVDGLDDFRLPVTIIQGEVNISNCIVSESLDKKLNVTLGMPLVFHINTRDSADNARIEGGEIFRVRTTLEEAFEAPDDIQSKWGSYGSAASALNPQRPAGATVEEYPICGVDKDEDGNQIYALCHPFPGRRSQYGPLPGAEHAEDDIVSCCYGYDTGKVPVRVLSAAGDHRELREGTNFVDLDNGKYRGEVVVTSQQQPDGTLVPLWGRYRLDIEGYTADGEWLPILSSPIYAQVSHVDCTMNGVLDGAASSVNEWGDQCECNLGYQELEGGQDGAQNTFLAPDIGACTYETCTFQSSVVLIVCEICPIASFGPVPTTPVWGGDRRLVPQGAGTSDSGPGVTKDGKYTIEARQGNIKTRVTYNHNKAPGDHKCISCPKYQHTLQEGTYNVSQCICQPGFYDWRKYELGCSHTPRLAWKMFNDGVILNTQEAWRQNEVNPPEMKLSAPGAIPPPHDATEAYQEFITINNGMGARYPSMLWPPVVSIDDNSMCLPCFYESSGGNTQIDCFDCFGNDTIATRPGFWVYNEDDSYDKYIDAVGSPLESAPCSEEEAGEDSPRGWSMGCMTWERAKSASFWTQGLERINLYAYKCPSCVDMKDNDGVRTPGVGTEDADYDPKCTCPGGIVAHPDPSFALKTGPRGCSVGSAGGVTCAACTPGGRAPGRCELTGVEDIDSRSIDCSLPLTESECMRHKSMANPSFPCSACPSGVIEDACYYPSYKNSETGCVPCPEDMLTVHWDMVLIGSVFASVALYMVVKVINMIRQQDLLLLKIFLSFGQCVQSFSVTYTITWPEFLAEFYKYLKVFNIDIFEFGGMDCMFPFLKSFYTKFMITVFIPPAFVVLLVLGYLHSLRKLIKRRGVTAQVSMLEQKIERVELSGGYWSKAFFMLIVLYLKVSQTVIEIFRTKEYEPTPKWDQRYSLNINAMDCDDMGCMEKTSYRSWEVSDRCYLVADVRLSCTAALYRFLFLPTGTALVLVYPVGIPAGFLWLLMRDRDQIHDAISRMKFGFLYADYLGKYFYWEVWDLFRKLVLSSLFIFFRPGSVTQILCATVFSLLSLALHVHVMPYAFHTANMCQLLALNCIMLSLFGALLIKVRMDATQQANTEWFVNWFLLFVNVCVPLVIFATVLAKLILSLYMRTVGKVTHAVVGHTARISMELMLKKQKQKKGEKGSGWFYYVRRKFIDTFWRTEDIDVLLLADEALALRQRKLQRDRADIALMGAKVELAEKREWLRFVKNNSGNQQEFNEIIQNESIDTYKRRLLGAQAVDQEKLFWDNFYGVQTSNEQAAFDNAAYKRRYTDQKELERMEEEDGLHALDEYKIQRKHDKEEIQDIHDGQHETEEQVEIREALEKKKQDEGLKATKSRGSKLLDSEQIGIKRTKSQDAELEKEKGREQGWDRLSSDDEDPKNMTKKARRAKKKAEAADAKAAAKKAKEEAKEQKQLAKEAAAAIAAAEAEAKAKQEAEAAEEVFDL